MSNLVGPTPADPLKRLVGPKTLGARRDDHAQARRSLGFSVRKSSLNLRLFGPQFGKPFEDDADNTIAADTHEWKRIFRVGPDT
jgi:hypothetical protein